MHPSFLLKCIFYIIFGGLEYVGLSLAYVAHLLYDFWEMSGFEPESLPLHAGALPT